MTFKLNHSFLAGKKYKVYMYSAYTTIGAPGMTEAIMHVYRTFEQVERVKVQHMSCM